MPKEKALIFDLDGTIADNRHRIVYRHDGRLNWDILLDPTLIRKDTLMAPNIPELLRHVKKNFKVVLLTGRVHKQKAETLRWLENYNIPYDRLIMRSADETYIKDAVFKEKRTRELLAQYDIVLALDDMSRTLEMYEKLDIATYKINSSDDWNNFLSILTEYEGT